MSDVYAARLIGWAVNRFGMAIVFSIIAGGILGAIAAATGSVGWLYFAGIACPVIFGLYLGFGDPPMPYTAEELASVGADSED